MQAQLLQGLYLMLVGMGFVLAFLSLVVVALIILERIAPKLTASERFVEPQQIPVEDTAIRAAISAAVHAYRKRHRSKD